MGPSLTSIAFNRLTIFPWIAIIFMMCNCANGPVGRVLRYGNSGIQDYTIFPYRELRASPNPQPYPMDTLKASRRFASRVSMPDSLHQVLEHSQTVAFLILHRDTLVMERYFQGVVGTDYSLLFSMSKSVMTLLIGCAIDDGLITSEGDLVIKYIPELRVNGFSSITLLDLINMTAPIKYAENDNPFGKHARFYYTEELEKEILELRAVKRDKRKFVYRSANTAILGLVLKRALTTESITNYLQRRLWTPLGMESNGLWSIDHDSTGIEKTWCCLASTARDFLKIVDLLLKCGKWDNRQVVSEAWINKTFAWSKTANYNFGWWTLPDRGELLSVGKDGQFAYLSPVTHTIIIRLGTGMGGLSRDDWIKIFGRLDSILDGSN